MTKRGDSQAKLLTLTAIVVGVTTLYVARQIFLPVALAVLISFLLSPLVSRLERWGLSRIPSVLSVVGVACVILGALGWIVTFQLVDLSKKLPDYRSNVLAKVHSITEKSKAVSRLVKSFGDMQTEVAGDGSKTPNSQPDQPPRTTVEAAQNWLGLTGSAKSLEEKKDGGAVAVKVVELPPSPLEQVRTWLGPLVEPLATAGMVAVLVVFMLFQREDLRNRFVQLFGVAHMHATTEALQDVAERVSRYLRMQFLINATYGVLVASGLSLMGVPNGVMWGVLSFSLRFLPYLGPLMAAMMPLTVSLAVSTGWQQPLMVAGWFISLEVIIVNVVEPLLYGSSIGVSGVGIIVAVIFWTWVWGPIGLVLAMPLTTCMVVLAKYVPALRFITVLLGNQPTLSLEERIYQRLLAFDATEPRKLAEAFLKTRPRLEFYDEVLIPALALAERDRHAGLLSDDQEDFIQEASRILVSASSEPASPAALAGDPEAGPSPRQLERLRVLCIPLRDEIDAAAAEMLEQLLVAEGAEVHVASLESLTTELVDAVDVTHPDLALISIVPPLPARDSRLLCRRLRDRYPTLPIFIGYWTRVEIDSNRARLAAAADAEIVPSLGDALERARAIASRTAAAAPDKWSAASA